MKSIWQKKKEKDSLCYVKASVHITNLCKIGYKNMFEK